jgi:hypothetical protein
MEIAILATIWLIFDFGVCYLGRTSKYTYDTAGRKTLK